MNKAYNRINWQNQPSTATALGATNLNKIDVAVNTIDDRVIELETTKFPKNEALSMVANWDMNLSTGVITVTLKNGTIKTYDTALEKVPISGVVDVNTNQLIFTNSDGTTTSVDLAKLITQYEFVDTETVGFSIGADGKVSCFVKDGSITSEKLDPSLLSTIQISSSQAALAKRYAVGGVEEGDEFDNAKYYKEQAEIAKDHAVGVVGIDAERLYWVEVNSVKYGNYLTNEDLERIFAGTYVEVHPPSLGDSPYPESNEPIDTVTITNILI